MSNVILSSPDVLTLADNQNERDAILLECCDLPDKQLTLSESDLDGIVSRFTSAPIKVEHVDSPLDPLGHVQRVWRTGKQLLGRVSFPPEMASFVRQRGALKLSCGLDRSPFTLKEVSLVLKPRLAAAVLLSEDDAAELVRLRLDNAQQLAALTAARVDSQIATLKRSGKIVPATEAAARVLLSAVDAGAARITLSDGTSQSVAEAFAAYLAAQPAVVTLSEFAEVDPAKVAAANQAAQDNPDQFTTEEADFLSRRLGVDPAKVAETIKAEGGKIADARSSL